MVETDSGDGILLESTIGDRFYQSSFAGIL